jgi:hypothetical protein
MMKRGDKKDKLKASPNVGNNIPLFNTYQFQKWLPGWLALVRKPSRWSEGPSAAALVEGLDPPQKLLINFVGLMVKTFYSRLPAFLA